MRSPSFAPYLIALILSDSVSAFIAPPCGITTGPSSVALSLSTPSCGTPSITTSCARSTFLQTTFASIAAVTTSLCIPEVSFADDALDDLSMPSVSEQKATDVS